MKKTSLALAALALVFSTSGFAATKKKSVSTETTSRTRVQSASIPISRVIPQISIIMSSAIGDAAQNLNGKTGFGFGGLLDMGRSDLVVETGLLYRNLGVTGEDPQVGSVNINLAYLSIPINAKYYFMGQKAPVSVFAKGGILPGFNVGSSAEFGGKSYALKDGVNGFDFALDVGAGAKFAMAESLDIYSELNYARSLTRAFSKSEASNSAFTIQAGMAVEL